MALRLISVTYGHHGSGQAYDYLTEKSYRAGDVVVVPVTHPKSRKRYNTLGVVEFTHSDPDKVQKHIDYLKGGRDNKGRFTKKVEIKNVSERLEVAQELGQKVTTDRQVNIRTLPGYDTRVSDNSWSGLGRRSSSRLLTRI